MTEMDSDACKPFVMQPQKTYLGTCASSEDTDQAFVHSHQNYHWAHFLLPSM